MYISSEKLVDTGVILMQQRASFHFLLSFLSDRRSTVLQRFRPPLPSVRHACGESLTHERSRQKQSAPSIQHIRINAVASVQHRGGMTVVGVCVPFRYTHLQTTTKRVICFVFEIANER